MRHPAKMPLAADDRIRDRGRRKANDIVYLATEGRRSIARMRVSAATLTREMRVRRIIRGLKTACYTTVKASDRGALYSVGSIQQCDFRGITFMSGGFAPGTAFVGCDLRQAEFVGCDLRGVSFNGCDLQGTSFEDCDMHGMRLRDSTWKANLWNCRGFVMLPVADPRGYGNTYAHINLLDDEVRILAGCRNFSVADALYHWGPSYGGMRRIGDMYVSAVKWLVANPIRGGR